MRALRPLVVALALLAVALGLARPAQAAAPPVAWCGSDEVSANRVPDLQVSSTAQIRVVYAIPSDGVDQFAQDASPIATDVASIDTWWRGQDPTRTPRFDLYPFSGCTSTFGRLDLGFVRLPNTGSYYSDANSIVDLLAQDLGSTTDQAVKTLVYYDGPISDSQICGTSYTSPTDGGQDGFAFVFVQANCYSDLGTGGGEARVAAHELTHDLGAVPDAAPNNCLPPDDGHVCDSKTDLMYPYTYDGETIDTAVLDVGNDDYYNHGGSWWDVRNSPWLAHLPQFTLAAASQGPGTVTGVPGAAACTSGCSAMLDNGLSVRLVPRPAAGAVFVGWQGACTGIGTCRVKMDAPKSATARFGVKPKAKPKPKKR